MSTNSPSLENAPQPEPSNELVLPGARLNFAKENLPELQRRFIEWAAARRVDHTSILSFTDIQEWARDHGAEMTPDTMATLSKLYHEVRQTLGELEQQLYLPLTPAPEISFAKLMSQDVDDEQRRKKEEQLKEEGLDPHAANHYREMRADKEERDRHSVRAAIHLPRPTKDSAAAKDLEFRLLTKNVAPEDYQAVLQFLAEIAEMQPSRSVGCLLGSRK